MQFNLGRANLSYGIYSAHVIQIIKMAGYGFYADCCRVRMKFEASEELIFGSVVPNSC